MIRVYTDEALLARLRLAAQRSMGPEEVRRQKISWVMGMMPFGSDVTYDEVAAIVDRHEGRAA